MVATHTALVQKLRVVTRSLIDETRPAFSLRNEILEMKSVFETAGGDTIASVDDIATGETITAEGVAISPTMAAMCVDDFVRTVQFIRGAHAAIRDLRSTVIERPVRVLYAGCGPWAALAVPLMTLFAAGEVVFALVDIHGESIESVGRIIDTLQLKDRVAGLEVADAADYRIDPTNLPDMIMIEMMRAGLESEPQVGVSMHLIRQAQRAVLIPAEIGLDLMLINGRQEFDLDTATPRDRIQVGRLLTLNRATLLQRELPSCVLEIPAHDSSRYRPMICTEIRVYADHVLRDYDSGITCPRKLAIDGELNAGDRVSVSYEQGGRPGLRVKRLI